MIENVEKPIIVNLGFSEKGTLHIDKEEASKVIKMLSSNLYSNVVESVVRELTNNAYDTEKELGKEPCPKIEIKDNTIYFSDKGTGLSKDFMLNYYTRVGYSTKSNTNEFIGSKGLGRVSPFSYIDKNNIPFFNIETNVNGIKYLWQIYKNEDLLPEVLLLDENSTEEENGTTVYFKIKNSYDFENAIKNQLLYFPKLEIIGVSIPNNTIYKGNHFIVSSLIRKNYSYVGACYGLNKYPINYDILGIPKLNYNFDLYFDIGELSVTPNRESLEYDQKTKTNILAKIKLVKEELQERYNKENENFENLFLYYQKSQFVPSIMINDENLTIVGLIDAFKSNYYLSFKEDFNLPSLEKMKEIFKIQKSTKHNNTFTLKNSCYKEENTKSVNKLSYNNKYFAFNISSDAILEFNKTNYLPVYEDDYKSFIKWFIEDVKKVLPSYKSLPNSPSNYTPINKEEVTIYNKKRHYNSWNSNVVTIESLNKSKVPIYIVDNSAKYSSIDDELLEKFPIYYVKSTSKLKKIKYYPLQDLYKSNEYLRYKFKGYIINKLSIVKNIPYFKYNGLKFKMDKFKSLYNTKNYLYCSNNIFKDTIYENRASLVDSFVKEYQKIEKEFAIFNLDKQILIKAKRYDQNTTNKQLIVN